MADDRLKRFVYGSIDEVEVLTQEEAEKEKEKEKEKEQE